MNASFLPSQLRKDIPHSLVLDIIVVVGLMLAALVAFYVTPEFAANLPQDGVDFAVPAVNLLERGQLAVSLYGYNVPSSHPFGTSLLMVPAYVLFGHGFGNGIYAILLCGFGAIALTYFIGVKLAGRMCGSFAALFLITHYGFWQYSQKIMSEVPSVLPATAMLALLLTIRDRKHPMLTCLAAGAVLGFAIMVRYDNILLGLPAVLLLVWDGTGRERLTRVGALVAGMAPFLVTLAVYDQVTFGSPWRTGYQYHGAAGTADQPLFSVEYVTKQGFTRLRGVTEQIPGTIEGNGTFYFKSLLSEADTTRIFGHPAYWQAPGRRLFQTLVLFRTGLGVIGILACLAAWRVHSARRRFLVWLVVATIAYVCFYLLYTWQEERFLMRVVPVFCLASALGVATLLGKWASKAIRGTMLFLAGALIAAFAFFNWQMGFPSGNDLHLYEVLTRVAQQAESNAVVVSNFDPLRLDAYVIRGTARIAVPVGHHPDSVNFVGSDPAPQLLRPFIASEDPDKLREFLRSGRPVYWLVNDPWSGQPSSELATLQQLFRLQVLATANVNGRGERPYFGRIYDLPQRR